MGRTYYSTARPDDKRDPARLVHVLKTPRGTVVLAMRPPEQRERGYSVGVDCTVVDAVLEMFNDWGPSDPGPGWVACAELVRHRVDANGHTKNVGAEQTYDVTILAAFEAEPQRNAIDLDTEQGGRIRMVADILRRWPLVPDGEEFDPYQGNAEKAEACVSAVLDGIMPTFLRPECEECGMFTDDDGKCGACANCKMPLCVHEVPDEKWKEIADRFDPPCDRWKLKSDGTFDADATHGKGGESC